MTNRYHINVFWYEPDLCWIADVPDLEGCSAHGNDAQSAVAEAMIAINEWIACATECGDPIPEPRYRAPMLIEAKAA
jgi:predicted RNase H-like HicB family nuclease